MIPLKITGVGLFIYIMVILFWYAYEIGQLKTKIRRLERDRI